MSAMGGGAGADRIYGGLGFDFLSGDGGADVFVYESAAEAPFDEVWGSASEWISQLESTDRIDVSAIDANSSLPGVQHFTLGDGDHEQGTIEIVPVDWGWTVVRGYIDADDQPDFYLTIGPDENGSLSPVTADSFILA